MKPPASLTEKQIQLIKEIFTKAEERGIPLWLESGWAIDARLGRVTREHEDIDIAFPYEKQLKFEQILREIGCDKRDDYDYGFLIYKGDVLIDAEPCFKNKRGYSPKGFPEKSCLDKKDGIIDSYKVRCLTWEAMFYEFLFYTREVSKNKWRQKDFDTLKVIEGHLSEGTKQNLKREFHIKMAKYNKSTSFAEYY